MTARNIALAISLGCHVASQPMLSLGGQGTATSSPQEERRLLTQKAMGLLEEALSDRQHVRLAENRVRLAAIAAGSLWTIDPDRSRALFQEAKQELIVLIDRIDPSYRDYYSQVGIPQQLRHEILAMISQKDPALALDFIRTTRLPPRPKSGPFDHPHDEEAAIELQLAAQIASNDPSQAFRLACEQLERGPSPNTVNVLFSLQEKSPEMAKELSQLFFQKLQSSIVASNSEASNVLTMLLHSSIHFDSLPQGSTPANRERQRKVRAFREYLFRQGVETAGAYLSEQNLDSSITDPQELQSYKNLVMTLHSMLPSVEKVSPQRAAEFRRKAKEMPASADPYERIQREYREILDKSSIDEMLAAASRLPEESKDGFYQTAIWTSQSRQNPAQMRQAIAQQVSNAQMRHRLLEQLDQQIAQRDAANGKVAEAMERISQLNSGEARARALITLAHSLPEQQRDTASKLLSQALSEVANRAENAQSMQAQLEVLNLLASRKTGATEGFGILETLVGQLNSLVDAMAVLDGFVGQNQFKEGEFLCQQGSQMGQYVFQAINTLAALASRDFDRALQIANRFQRVELRAWAHVGVAQAGLPTATPPPMF